MVEFLIFFQAMKFWSKGEPFPIIYVDSKDDAQVYVIHILRIFQYIFLTTSLIL